MNDLIERTIEYLARQKAAEELEGSSTAQVEEAAKRTDTVFVGGAFFVEKLTYIIEERIGSDRLSDGRLFINVHGFANFLKRRARYETIDQLDNEIYVYGSDECPEWPFQHARPITLDPADGLRVCWFAVYANHDTSFCLVARRLRKRPGDAEKYRFRGFWTTRPQITHYVCDYLVRVVNAQYGA